MSVLPSRRTTGNCGHPRYVDIGAGSTRDAARWLRASEPLAEAWCFDPGTHAFATDLPSRRHPRVHVVRAAVTASHADTVPFHVANDPGASSLLPFGPDVKLWRYPLGRVRFRTVRTVQVPALRMDDLIVSRGIPDLAFVRVDVCGAALDVLRSFGDHISTVNELAVKVHTTPHQIYRGQATTEDVIRYMDQAGFELAAERPISFDQEAVVWFRNRKPLRHFRDFGGSDTR